MSRYFTSCSLNNLKNALKSGGSGIVAIKYLPGCLHCFEPLVRRFATPIPLLLFVLLPKRDDGKSTPIDIELVLIHDRQRTGFAFEKL